MTDWVAAAAKATRTHKWSITMTRWLVSRLRTKPVWKLITFGGPQGEESIGVVDILALRKNHKLGRNGLLRGDLFDIILIQVKGGSARWPSASDIKRLRLVARRYRAKAVLLGAWRKGSQPVLYRLRSRGSDARTAWQRLDSAREMFS
jgi:hypothetical protein